MAKPRKTGRKPSVKVNDMKAREDPKGGAYDAFLKFETPKATTAGDTPILKRTRTNKVQL